METKIDKIKKIIQDKLDELEDSINFELDKMDQEREFYNYYEKEFQIDYALKNSLKDILEVIDNE